VTLNFTVSKCGDFNTHFFDDLISRNSDDHSLHKCKPGDCVLLRLANIASDITNVRSGVSDKSRPVWGGY
jgi:hypothetical protein